MYSCFVAAIGLDVVPSHWHTVEMSVFHTHSLGNMAQCRPRWHTSHAKFFPGEKKKNAAKRGWAEAEEERRCWAEIDDCERQCRKWWTMIIESNEVLKSRGGGRGSGFEWVQMQCEKGQRRRRTDKWPERKEECLWDFPFFLLSPPKSSQADPSSPPSLHSPLR